MTSSAPLPPLRIAVVDRGTECEIHVRNAGTEPLKRLRLQVADQGRLWDRESNRYTGEIAEGLPTELAPDGRAKALLRLTVHRRCVHVSVTAIAGAALQRWRGWVFVGGFHVPAIPPWPQRLMQDTTTQVTLVLTGQGPRRVITLINEGTSILRDCSMDLLSGEDLVSGLLQGRCPQRIDVGGRVTLVLEEQGPERAYVLSFRYVDFRGQDHVMARDLVVGRPT